MRNSKKTKGIIFTITAVALVILITLTLCLYFMLFVYGAYQPYSPEQRQILLRNFDNVNYNKPNISIIRDINSENPIAFIDYRGDSNGLITLWQAIPADARPYTVVIINFDDILRPGKSESLNNIDKLINSCEQNDITFAAEVLTGSTQHEWLLPIAYIEEVFLTSPNCMGLAISNVYSAGNARGLLDGNFSGYIADLINISAKHGQYTIWSDCNYFGENGTVIDWIENDEYLYSSMLTNSDNIIMMASNQDYARSTYSVLLGMYLSGIIGNWGIATDVSGYDNIVTNNGEYKSGAVNASKKTKNADKELRYDSLYLAAAYGATAYSFVNSNGKNAQAMQSAEFRFSVMPFLNAIVKGEYGLPDRQDVLDTIKFAVVGGKNFIDYDRSIGKDKYSISDYGVIPVLPSNIRTNERQIFNDNKIQLIERELTPEIVEKYANDNTGGNAYIQQAGKVWYYSYDPHNASDIADNVTVKNIYDNGALAMSISSFPKTYAMIIENAASLKFSVNNYNGYDGEDAQLRKTVITVKLNEGEVPYVEFSQDNAYTAKYNREIIISGNTATISITHNGAVEFTVYTGASKGLDPPAKEDVNNAVIERNPDLDYSNCEILINTIDWIMSDRENYTKVGIWNLLNYRNVLARVVVEQNMNEMQLNSIIADYSYRYGLLLDIKEQARILKLYKDIGDNKLDKAFDLLLRELLSPTDYVEGKENGEILGFPYSKNIYEHNLKKIKISEINKAQKVLHSKLLENGLYSA